MEKESKYVRKNGRRDRIDEKKEKRESERKILIGRR